MGVTLRKRHTGVSIDAEVPVTTPPPVPHLREGGPTGADSSDKPKPITAEPAPRVEEPPKENPVKEAEIKARLAEMERAAELNRSTPPQQPPPIVEPDEEERIRQHVLEQTIAPLPNEESRQFFREHPELLFDPRQQARANHYHYVTMDEVGEPYTPQWVARMKYHLGIDQSKPQPRPQRQAAPAAPSNSVPYSAPPTREVPSMSSGRPARYNSKITLSAEEREMAKLSNISEQEYAKQKLRMLREKDDGYGQQ